MSAARLVPSPSPTTAAVADARYAADRELAAARATLAQRRRDAAAAVVRDAAIPEDLLRVDARVRELELVLEGLADLAVAAQYFELGETIASAEAERADVDSRIPDLDATLIELASADPPLDPTGQHVDLDEADRRHTAARKELYQARSRSSHLSDVIESTRLRRAELLRSHPFVREMDAATS